MENIKICNHSIEEYEGLIKSFHGSLAPGLIIGGFMVDMALKNLPKDKFFDVICESNKCLPDAIQILTPCSIGNGWLKILKIGRFATTFYEKYEGDGLRVYLDTKKLDSWPEVKSWFLKLVPKREQNTDLLLEQIKKAGADILSMQKVKIDVSMFQKKKDSKIAICPDCNEAYPEKHGSKCRVCSKEIVYFSDRKSVV